MEKTTSEKTNITVYENKCNKKYILYFFNF